MQLQLGSPQKHICDWEETGWFLKGFILKCIQLQIPVVFSPLRALKWSLNLWHVLRYTTFFFQIKLKIGINIQRQW